MYIAPGQGPTNPWGQNFDVNRKAISFWPFVASCKKITLKSDFIYIFNVFMPVYSPRPGAESRGARADKPLGSKFLCQQKAFTTSTICCKFKKISLNSDFIHIFNVFPHIDSPGAGADNPLWTQFWCQQKGLVTLPICCTFKKISLKSDFIHIFACFIHVYSPGTGADNPLGSEFLF